MKKYVLTLSTVLLGLSVLFAQKIKETDLPQPVKSSFAKSFPDVNAKWEKEKGNYEASFKKNGKNMSATFQPDGTFLESETTIKNSELPESVLNYIKTNYQGKKISEAAKITSASGLLTYEAEVSGTDLIFDEHGNFLKEVKD